MKVLFDEAVVGLLARSRLPVSRAQDASLKTSITPEFLASQLEGRWAGVDRLTEQRKRAFLQLSDHMRGIGADKACLDYKLGIRRMEMFDIEAIDECALAHVHVATVTIAMIAKAKSARGILASSEYHWSRSADPAFWLMVNGYGRPSHDVRIAGAFAHYGLEAERGIALSASYFDTTAVFMAGRQVMAPVGVLTDVGDALEPLDIFDI